MIKDMLLGCAFLLALLALADVLTAFCFWLPYVVMQSVTNWPPLPFWVFTLLALPFMCLMVSIRVTMSNQRHIQDY